MENVLPVNTEDFLSPAVSGFVDGKEEEQNAHRERITCAMGLDTQFELSVPEENGELFGNGEYKPQGFCPRHSSSAAPPAVCGIFPPESVYRENIHDPILLGRKLKETAPIDVALYKLRDPRKISQTSIIRDFGCKIPIDMVDTAKIAEAVLNYYPDKYLNFLKDFVSNMFGDAMKQFLAVQMKGYRDMLERPAEINRMSWGAFTAVRGRDMKSSDATHIQDPPNIDVTLRMGSDIVQEMNRLAINGTGMTSNVDSREFFNLRPCIQQHIETLRMMHDELCQGFATKEANVVVMMMYANQAGLRLCQDRLLMTKQDRPDYDLITCPVPLSLFENLGDPLDIPVVTEPDSLSTIYADMKDERNTKTNSLPVLLHKVGRWSGSEDASNIFLNSAVVSPFAWGWGHPCNLFQFQKGQKSAGGASAEFMELMAPYLKYTVKRTENGTLGGGGGGDPTLAAGTVHLDSESIRSNAKNFVKKWEEIWKDSNTNLPERKELIDGGDELKERSLRDALVGYAPPDRKRGEGLFYRGNEGDEYRSAVVDYGDELLRPHPTHRNSTVLDAVNRSHEERKHRPESHEGGCSPSDGEEQVFQKKMCTAGLGIDPFLKGGLCMRYDDNGDLSFSKERLGVYTTQQAFCSKPIQGMVARYIANPSIVTDFAAGANFVNIVVNAVTNANGGANIQASEMALQQLALDKQLRGNALPVTVLNVSRNHKCDYIYEPRYASPVGNDVLTIRPGGSGLSAIMKVIAFRKQVMYSMGTDMAVLVCYDPAMFGYWQQGDLGVNDIDTQELFQTHWRAAKKAKAVRSEFNVTNFHVMNTTSSAFTSELTEADEFANFMLWNMQRRLEIIQKVVTKYEVKDMKPSMKWDESSTDDKDVHNFSNLIMEIIMLFHLPLLKGTLRDESYVTHLERTKNLHSNFAKMLKKHVDVKGGDLSTELFVALNKLFNPILLDQRDNDHYADDDRRLKRRSQDSFGFMLDPHLLYCSSVGSWVEKYDERLLTQSMNALTRFKSTIAGITTNINPATTELFEIDYADPPGKEFASKLVKEYVIDYHRSEENVPAVREVISQLLNNDSIPFKRHQAATYRAGGGGGLPLPSPHLYATGTTPAMMAAYVRYLNALETQEADKTALETHIAAPPPAAAPTLVTEAWHQTLEQLRDDHRTSSINVDPALNAYWVTVFANNPNLHDSMKKIWNQYYTNQPHKTMYTGFTAMKIMNQESSDPSKGLTAAHLRVLVGFLQQLIQDQMPPGSRGLQLMNKWRAYSADTIVVNLTEDYANFVTNLDTQIHRKFGTTRSDAERRTMKENVIAYRNRLRTKDPADDASYSIEQMQHDLPGGGLNPNRKYRATDATQTVHRPGTAEDYPAIPPVLNFAVYRVPEMEMDRFNPGPSGDTFVDGQNLTQPFGPVPDPTREYTIEGITGPITASRMVFMALRREDRKLQHDENGGIGGDFAGWYNPCAYQIPDVTQPHGGRPVVQTTSTRPQLFSILDAAALIYKMRTFKTAAESNRPFHNDTGDIENLHRWCELLIESFLAARETYAANNKEDSDQIWESVVKSNPLKAFPSDMIGAISDTEFANYFPLIPKDHKIRDKLRKVRSLDMMWGSLTSYSSRPENGTQMGAWMPLSEAHRCKLLETFNLFDQKEKVPSNPWLPRAGNGIVKIFHQSYHNFYPTVIGANYYKEWLRDACKYQVPDPSQCQYPFAQYGGTPVEADFIRHRVEKPRKDDEYLRLRHAMLTYNRYGITAPMRLGQQYDDQGLLQEMFSFEYRQQLRLTKSQRVLTAEHVWPTNFLAYARNHAILALASVNHGTENASESRVVRNLFRLYIDVFPDMSAGLGSEAVPVVMGFLPTTNKERPVMMFAGTLPCINAKLERFCMDRPAACDSYKITYLNDAVLLYTRIAKAERRKRIHRRNYQVAKSRRTKTFTITDFYEELVDVQDAYVEFLQTTIMSMMVESGVDMSNVPLNLLEPREISVSSHAEDTDLVGNDFLGPRTRDIIKDMNFDTESLNRTQLAILSLMPPNHRIFGTLRLNQTTEVVDMEHIRKQVQKQAISDNKKVWNDHMQKVIRASLASRFLERNGPIEFGLDESSFKDPLVEANKIALKMSTTNREQSSSTSMNKRAYEMRKERGPTSSYAKTTIDYDTAIEMLKEKVEQHYQRGGGTKDKMQCINELPRVPESWKEKLRILYQQGVGYS